MQRMVAIQGKVDKYATKAGDFNRISLNYC